MARRCGTFGRAFVRSAACATPSRQKVHDRAETHTRDRACGSIDDGCRQCVDASHDEGRGRGAGGGDCGKAASATMWKAVRESWANPARALRLLFALASTDGTVRRIDSDPGCAPSSWTAGRPYSRVPIGIGRLGEWRISIFGYK